MPPVKSKEDGTDEETMAFTKTDEKDVEAPEFESKVKFANGGAEAVVDVQGETRLENKQDEFVGLSKEELMKYADDPYWKRIRRILLILFVVIWVGMLAAACLIIALAPKCPPRPDQEWWQTCNAYQVLPKSFKDTDDNGVGDIKGIHEKVEYLHEDLNVTAVYISSFYSENGHKEIDPQLGSIEDFESLKTAAHKKNMKIIVDFIPNHTSMKHPWFVKSQMKEGNYTDYYVWHAGIGSDNPPEAPNNWLSVVDGNSAWTWDSVRGEYYFHQFGADQPDLNLRNGHVQKELRDILLFWIEKGVDGFRVNNVAYLFEHDNLTLLEPVINDPNIAPESYDRLNHIYTTFQPETFQIITTWREILDNKGKDDGKERLLIVDAMGDEANHTASFLQYNGKDGAQLLLNPSLTGVEAGCDANCVHNMVQTYLDVTGPLNVWPTWQSGNQDVSRLASRMGSDDYLAALTMIFLTLPGTPFTYYGEEIAMVDVAVPTSVQDGAPQRTPMQWNTSSFAGFTKGNSSWLPVSADYTSRNVMSEKAVGAGITNLDVYSKLGGLRKNPSFQWGDTQAAVHDNIYFYVRKAKGFSGFLVAVNLGDGPTTIDFVLMAPAGSEIPSMGEIVATTGNIVDKDLQVGKSVGLSSIVFGPKVGVIFKFD